jgi:hypothetical protein
MQWANNSMATADKTALRLQMDSIYLRLVFSQLKEKGWLCLPTAIANTTPEIVSRLGPIIPPARGEADYRDLVPYEAALAPPSSMSSITGTGEQPMHTDSAYLPTPPRFIALHCLNAGEFPCPTHLWIVDHDLLLRDRPSCLAESKWVFKGGDHPPFYSSINEVRGGQMRTRFDPLCMRETCAAPTAMAEAESALKNYTHHLLFEWEQGSLLVLDNWRCLHARGTGADKSPSRKLRRWSIGATNGLGN